jgi:cullin 3
VNNNEKAPEFVSLFIDEHLRKGLKGKTDSETESVLSKTITIFRYITEKDVFERYYKGHLAKRLLQGKSVSDDAERGMLAKLKVESGFQFTQKLEGMFNDMRLSEETMVDWRKWVAKRDEPPSIDLSVTVMTANSWPLSYTGTPCTLPESLSSLTKLFERFYLSQHSGRRLTWQPSQGNADVLVRFAAKSVTLNVSTYAMVILLLFEGVEEGGILTYEELASATSILPTDLKRHLQSLSCVPKRKILKKHPPGRDVDESDSFSFNHEFTCPTSKLKIGVISSRVESGGERKETREYVTEERKYEAKACIVRVMKSRKHLTHSELVNEVTKQLSSRYRPDPQDLKKRIEELIETEYLERCEDRKSYNYLA